MQGIGRRDDLRIPYPGPEALIACMSAFGTKRTWDSDLSMSAFGGIADIGSCLLYPRKRTLVERLAKSALCQQQTSCDFGQRCETAATVVGDRPACALGSPRIQAGPGAYAAALAAISAM